MAKQDTTMKVANGSDTAFLFRNRTGESLFRDVRWHSAPNAGVIAARKREHRTQENARDFGRHLRLAARAYLHCLVCLPSTAIASAAVDASPRRRLLR